MQVVAVGPLPVSSLVWQASGATWALTVVAKATFALAPVESPLAPDQDPIEVRERHWDDDPSRSLQAASDLAPFKQSPEVLLVGRAYAPRGQPVRSLVVRMVVGDVDKSILVHADRAFSQQGELSEGPRFTSMPLVYERAAGGPDTWNAAGVRRGARDRYGRIAVANLTLPDKVVTGPEVFVDPVGLGPIAWTWPARREKLGRHAATWSARSLAEGPLPEDVDRAFFNVSPLDQRLGEIRDNERIVLDNLHPDHAHLVTSLPGVRPRAVVTGRASGPHELPLRCDTLVIDTDRLRVTATFRGQLALSHPQEAGRVLVGAELPGQPSQLEELLRARASEPPSRRPPPLPARPAARSPISESTVDLTAAVAAQAAMPFRTAAPPPPPSFSSHEPAREEGGAPPPPAFSQLREELAGPPPAAISSQTQEIVPPAPPPFSPPGPSVAPFSPPAPNVAPFSPPAPSVAPFSPHAAVRDEVAPPALVLPVGAASPTGTVSPWAGAAPVAGAAPTGTAAPVASAVAAPPPEVPQTIGAVLAASNAAAAALGVTPPAPVSTRELPEIEEEAVVEEQRRDVVLLVWLDRKHVRRMVRKPAWQRLLDALDDEPVDPEVDDPALSDEPGVLEEQAQALQILDGAAAIDAEGVRASIARARGDRRKLVPPMELVDGDLVLPFDEVETLKAMVSTVTPLAEGDEALGRAIASAEKLLASPGVTSAPAVAEGLTARIREVLGQGKPRVPVTMGETPKPPAQPVTAIDAQVERALLEQRHYQRRKVLGGPRLRGLLHVAGAKAPLVVYLPVAAADELPLAARFRARIVALLHLRVDEREAEPVALEAVALGRVVDLDG